MRRAFPILVLVAASLFLAAPAHAERSAPHGFFGVNWDGHIKVRSGEQMRWYQWEKMQDVGVESARTSFEWAWAEQHEGDAYNHGFTDGYVWLAASRKIKLLPVVILAPGWARATDHSFARPKDVHAYAKYLTSLVERYGPNGTYWPEHPELVKQPIREWQVWNEPGLTFHWNVRKGEDWAVEYGKLLRPAYRAVKKADPGARVVLAGLVNDSWNSLRRLYKKGDIHGRFDVAAVHPYTVQPKGVIEIVRRFRRAMRKGGDGGKPVWVTEFGLPASRGKVDDESPLQTSGKGMAQFLKHTFGRLNATRADPKVGATRGYWYTWASTYGDERIWNYTGLIRHRWGSSEESVADTQSLDAFRAVALKAEGR